MNQPPFSAAPATCPRCAVALQAGDALGLDEQDCPRCDGCALPAAGTAAMLRALGLSPTVVQQLAHDPQLKPLPDPGGPLRCPGCAGSMVAVKLKGVVVDCCFACGSTWLDGGELSRMSGGRLGRPSSSPSSSSSSSSSLSLSSSSSFPGVQTGSGLELARPVSRVVRQPQPLEEVFEMLWDCSSCGTRGLLGISHRHCPHCGAPQDQSTRYFPPEGHDTLVTGAWVYQGVDKVCPGCTTPNGGAADFCKNCGTPLDGTPRLVRERDGVVGGPAPTPPLPAHWSRPSRPQRIGAVVLVVVAVAIVIAVVWKKDVTVQVTGHSWSRVIGIERFEPRSESEWCSGMPHDAYSISRSREVRSHRQIADGETCTTKRESRGDGSYVKKKSCSPTYRSEPVYDDKCRYRVDRWGEVRSVNAAGNSVNDTLQWPTVPRLNTGTCIGCEREGSHRESYVVHLRGPSDVYHCGYGEGRWRAVADGAVLPMKVRVVTGGADCDTLGHR